METKTTQFKTLYKLHAEELYRFCFFRTKSKETAEDIVSESFAELYKVDFEKIENQRAWLFKVCRNIMYDTVFRTASKYTATFENQDIIEDFPENIDIAQVTIDAEMIALIKKEIEKLDPIASEIILLKIWEDLSFREIAEVTLMKENAVKQRFYRSLDLLKNNVDQNSSIKLNSFSVPVIAAGVLGISKMPSFALTTNLLPSIMASSGVIVGGAVAGSVAATGLLSTGFAQAAAAVIASATIAIGSIAGVQYLTQQEYPKEVEQGESDSDKQKNTVYKEFNYEAMNISFEVPETWNLKINNSFPGVNGDVRIDFYRDNQNGTLEEFTTATNAGAMNYFTIQACLYTSSNPIEYKTNPAGIRYAENSGIFKSYTTYGTCGSGQGETLPSQGVPAKIYMVELDPAITGSDLKFMTIGSTEGEIVGTKNDVDVKRLVESVKYSVQEEPMYKTFKSDRYNISFNYSANTPVVEYQQSNFPGSLESAKFNDIGLSVSWGNFIGGWGPCPDIDKMPTFTTKSGHTFTFCTSIDGQTGRVSIGGAIQVGTDENSKPILIVIQSIPSTEFVDKAKLISELSLIIESLEFDFSKYGVANEEPIYKAFKNDQYNINFQFPETLGVATTAYDGYENSLTVRFSQSKLEITLNNRAPYGDFSNGKENTEILLTESYTSNRGEQVYITVYTCLKRDSSSGICIWMPFSNDGIVFYATKLSSVEEAKEYIQIVKQIDPSLTSGVSEYYNNLNNR